jgi:hypothetical protein
MRLVSIAIGEAILDLIERGKFIVAHLLECDTASINYGNGYFIVPNNRRLTLLDVADAALSLNSLPL